MRPDDYSRLNNVPGRMQPNRPMQRPMQDFGPRLQPVQRPINNLQPQSPPSRPIRAYQQPAQQPFTPSQHMQRPAQPAQPQVPQPMTFEPKTKSQTHNKKRKLSKTRKAVLFGSVSVVIIAGGFLFFKSDKSETKQTAKAQNTQPALKPLEKPTFTAYYPSPMPAGLSVAKGSISYYKESFTFIIEQNGQKSFFVYEQPASADPDFNNLKTKLAAPKNIALTVGQGVEGGLDNGTVTAVKTDKNTIIIINCVKAVCSTAPRDILSSMQVNDDFEVVKHDNS